MSTTVQNHDWHMPIDFDTYELPTFPTEIFPEWLKQYVEGVAEASQTPVDASGIAALSILSAALAKKFVIKPFKEGEWEEKNNLYTLTVMPSGERKSVIHSMFTKPILEQEKEARLKIENNDMEPAEGTEGKDGKVLVRPPRYLSDDVTPERLVGLLKENDERMAILSSEGGLFETLNGRYSTIPNLDVFLKGYTWDYLNVDRMNRSETLYSPALTLGLFVQPSVLQGLPDRMADRGLFGRFLYALPVSLRGRRDVTPRKIDPEIVNRYTANIKALLAFQPDQYLTLTLDEEAERIFLDFMRRHEQRLNDDLVNESMNSWTERFPGHLLRIASLIHVADQLQDGQITPEAFNVSVGAETISNILRMSSYLVKHAKAAFGCIKSDDNLENAKYLWNVLYNWEGNQIRRQDVWRKTKGKFNKAEILDRAIYILTERGYVRTEEHRVSGRGRTGTVILINSLIKGPINNTEERLEVSEPVKATKRKPSRKLNPIVKG